MNRLFPDLDYRSESDWIVPQYFNMMDKDGRFEEAIQSILNRRSMSVNYVYCVFPYPEDVEEGESPLPRVGINADSVEVGLAELDRIARAACESYIKLHPNKSLSDLGFSDGVR